MNHETVNTVGQAVSLLTIVTTLAGFLPPLAALFAIIWYSILICDRIALSIKRRKEASNTVVVPGDAQE